MSSFPCQGFVQLAAPSCSGSSRLAISHSTMPALHKTNANEVYIQQSWGGKGEMNRWNPAPCSSLPERLTGTMFNYLRGLRMPSLCMHRTHLRMHMILYPERCVHSAHTHLLLVSVGHMQEKLPLNCRCQPQH